MSDIFYENIEEKTLGNTAYRKVVFTGKLQFVYMNIKPLDDIHKEIHAEHDQFIRIEQGNGEANIDGKIYKLYDGIGIIIPAGKEHQIINTSKDKELKLYTIYSPAEHKADLIQEENPDKYKMKYLKYKNKYLQKKTNL